MKIKYLLIVLFVFFLANCNNAKSEGEGIGRKYDGYVSDEVTAKKIAEAIWLPIYGSSILAEKPYKAKVIGDSIWVIESTLEKGKSGGTAYIEIRVNDGKILTVTHSK